MGAGVALPGILHIIDSADSIQEDDYQRRTTKTNTTSLGRLSARYSLSLSQDQVRSIYFPVSEEQLKSFLAKVKDDTSLQEKLKGAADADAALAIAKEAGFAITAQDIQSMQSSTDLSDDDLEGVAGGSSPWVFR